MHTQGSGAAKSYWKKHKINLHVAEDRRMGRSNHRGDSRGGGRLCSQTVEVICPAPRMHWPPVTKQKTNLEKCNAHCYASYTIVFCSNNFGF